MMQVQPKVKFPYAPLLMVFFGCVFMAVAMTHIYCEHKIKIEQMRAK